MALNATTLSSAVAAGPSGTDYIINVASATGITAPNFTSGSGITWLMVEQEWMQVTGVNGTAINVLRGQLGSCAAPHLSGSVVLAGLPTDFPSPVPISIKAQQDYYPNIVGFSAPVASATTITASGYFFHVTGTTAIATINAPASGPAGGSFPLNGSQITIVFDGVATWTAAGNIAVAGTPTTAGSSVTFTFDQGSGKWHPSRLA